MKYIRSGLIDQSANTHLTEALRVDDLVFISGQFAGDAAFQLVGGDDIVAQTEYVFHKIKGLLEEADASMDHIVMLHYFVVDTKDVNEILSVSQRHLDSSSVPAVFVQVPRLALRGARVGVTAIAVIRPRNAPPRKAAAHETVIAPCKGLQAGKLVFMSGIASGQTSIGNVEDKANILLTDFEQLMLNVGASREKIGWIQFFVRQTSDLQRVKRAFQNFFGSRPPASSIVQASELPFDASVAATSIGCLHEDQRRINDGGNGGRCEVFASGNLVFVSGQLATGDGHSVIDATDLATQTDQIFETLSHRLSNVGLKLKDVAWLQFFLADLNQRTVMTPSRRAYFGNHRPAAGLMQVAGPFHLPKAVLEVAALAVRRQVQD